MKHKDFFDDKFAQSIHLILRNLETQEWNLNLGMQYCKDTKITPQIQAPKTIFTLISCAVKYLTI